MIFDLESKLWSKAVIKTWDIIGDPLRALRRKSTEVDFSEVRVINIDAIKDFIQDQCDSYDLNYQGTSL